MRLKSGEVVSYGQTPLIWREWLWSTDSLTLRLKHLAQGQFHVQVIAQGTKLGKPGVLGIERRAVWQRNVLLYGNDTMPWVQACTTIAQREMTGSLRRVKFLRSRALGYLLFGRHRPKTRRIVRRTAEGWQRISYYQWHGRTLEVAETFLPAFEARLLCPSGIPFRGRPAWGHMRD